MEENLDLVDLFFSLPQKQRDRDFVTVKEIALLLGKDDSTIRQMVREQKLSGLRVVGRIRIHLPSVKKRLKDLNSE